MKRVRQWMVLVWMGRVGKYRTRCTPSGRRGETQMKVDAGAMLLLVDSAPFSGRKNDARGSVWQNGIKKSALWVPQQAHGGIRYLISPPSFLLF